MPEYLADNKAPEHQHNAMEAAVEFLGDAYKNEIELLLWLERNFTPTTSGWIWEKVMKCVEPRQENMKLLCDEVTLWKWMFHRLYKIHHGRHFEEDYKPSIEGVVQEGNIYDIRSLLDRKPPSN